MALTKITTNIIADNAITADKIDSSSLNTALSSASGYNNTNWDTAYGWGNHGAEGYLTTVSFADLTGKPTTLSGYGITDAFSGSYNDLSDTPTLFSGSYTDLSDKPTIPTVPTTVSSFTNDSNYATQTYVNTAVSDLVDNSPETLDTLNELAAALGDDPNFAATTAALIGEKAPLASPSFTGVVEVTNGTNSLSTTSGALTVTGGVGVGYNIHAGGIIDAAAGFEINGTTVIDLSRSAFLVDLELEGDLNIGGSGFFNNNSWAGTEGFVGYQHGSAESSRFGFSAPGTSYSIDVYTDGNFYATDNTYKVWHEGDTIFGPALDLTGDGSNNVPFKLKSDYSSWMISVVPDDNWGLFWAGNSGARYGTNSTEGPGNIFGNSSNPNEFAFVSSLGTAWSLHGTSGHTWQKGSAFIDGEIRLQRGSSDFSNTIRSAGYPSQGYIADTANYWLEYTTKGGHHFVVNSDGGVGAPENSYDDFNIWQGEIDGDRLLRVTNAGNVTAAGSVYANGSTNPLGAFVPDDSLHQLTLGASANTVVATTIPGDSLIIGSVHLTTTDSDSTDHSDVTIGNAYTNATTWSTSSGSYPSNPVANGTVGVSILGENQLVSQGHYGAWTPVSFRNMPNGDIAFSVNGNNASVRITLKITGYITR